MGDTPPRPRLIMLTQWFDPEPTTKGSKFARRMDELGFDVEVVTGFPNYPGGNVYDGYKIRPIKRERFGAVAVTRLPLYPSHDSSKVGRILNYSSFFTSAVIYLTFFSRKADIVYAFHPPLTVSTAAAIARIFRRHPVVLDIQDMWPDTLRATGMINSDWLLTMIGHLCRWTYRHVNHIVVQSNGFKKLLVERGVLAEKLTIIYNWADETEIKDPTVERSSTFGPQGPFRVLFAGNMGRAQGLDTVLDAAALLRAGSPDVEFCFLGDGIEAERLKQRAIHENLTNVRFLPRVPISEASVYLDAADCLLVHLKDDPLFEITVPSKTQAYLRAGRPIIMAVRGDAAKLIEDAKAGLAVPPDDAKSLAHAVLTLAAKSESERNWMGGNAKSYYESHLSLTKGTQRFAEIFRSVMKVADRA